LVLWVLLILWHSVLLLC